MHANDPDKRGHCGRPPADASTFINRSFTDDGSAKYHPRPAVRPPSAFTTANTMVNATISIDSACGSSMKDVVEASKAAPRMVVFLVEQEPRIPRRPLYHMVHGAF